MAFFHTPRHKSPFSPSFMLRCKKFGKKLRSAFSALGPGIVTGAADDDPSGITTFSQAGAMAGTMFLWTAWFATPLMIAIQEMCARIGLVTGKGLTGVLKKHYPPLLLFFLAALVVTANTINIGVDIAGMAAATHLVFPLPQWILAFGYATFVILVIIFLPYHKFAQYMKWLTLVLLLYFLVPFSLHIDWLAAFKHTAIPTIVWTKDRAMLLVALLGTTISPYLFFWQASIEVENKRDKMKTILERWIVTKHELLRMRGDVTIGMIFSNITMWFIILTTAVTLFSHGITNITTAQEAAEALRPIAGDFAYVLFMLGIVGTGLLAIPVLAGSSSYVLSEAFGWDTGLNKPFHKAAKFYIVMIVSTLLGVLMNAFHVDVIKALVYTAVMYGVISPPLIFVIMHIANNKKVMGKHTNSLASNVLGGITFVVMSTATILLFVL